MLKRMFITRLFGGKMTKRKIVAIIQARSGSTRLANKIHKKLHTKSLLEHIIERVTSLKCIDEIVIASTLNTQDRIIKSIAKKNSCKYFFGSQEDVLERFYFAAKENCADIIIRVTSDDPFKDPTIIQKALDLLMEKDLDYVSNTINPTYPEGIDIEIFTFKALQKAYKGAKLDSEKEHVTPYIWKNSKIFKVYNFEYTKNISHLRWTIDYECDFEFAKLVYEKLYPTKKLFLMQDILNLLQKEPYLSDIAQNVVRNEGYLKSLQTD